MRLRGRFSWSVLLMLSLLCCVTVIGFWPLHGPGFGLKVLVTFTWVLWAVGASVELHAGKLQGKRAPSAGVSIIPVLPLFPVIAVAIARLINWLIPPWGTRLVGGLHAVLATVFLVAIACAWRQIRSSGSPPPT